MIRASSISRISTYKPEFNKDNHQLLLMNFKEKAGEEFDESKIDKYLKTRGVITLTKSLVKSFEDKKSVDNPVLPPGAKQYIKELYLENQGFYNVEKKTMDVFSLTRGTKQEEAALSVLSQTIGREVRKNVDRVTNKDLFLTGEADVNYKLGSAFEEQKGVIRDCKVPKNFITFMSSKLNKVYQDQLYGYSILYDDIQTVHLDYILMPYDMNTVIKYFNPSYYDIQKIEAHNKKVESINPHTRVKTFSVDIDQEYKNFLIERLKMAKEFYNQLTLAEALNSEITDVSQVFN